MIDLLTEGPALAIPIALNVPVSLLFSSITFVNSDLNFFHVFSARDSFFHALTGFRLLPQYWGRETKG
jgi:hypothetical protein